MRSCLGNTKKAENVGVQVRVKTKSGTGRKENIKSKVCPKSAYLSVFKRDRESKSCHMNSTIPNRKILHDFGTELNLFVYVCVGVDRQFLQKKE